VTEVWDFLYNVFFGWRLALLEELCQQFSYLSGPRESSHRWCCCPSSAFSDVESYGAFEHWLGTLTSSPHPSVIPTRLQRDWWDVCFRKKKYCFSLTGLVKVLSGINVYESNEESPFLLETCTVHK
jgi:hypothetical protein